MKIKTGFGVQCCNQLIQPLAGTLGALFMLLPATSGMAQTYSVLRDFASRADGSQPCCLVRSGAVLYGAAEGGGKYGKGTIFSIGTDGANYFVLKEFRADEGNSYPTLTLSGTVLYGTLSYSGNDGLGVVFRMNTDGTGFTLLHSFSQATNSAGANPQAALTVSDGMLYGTTAYGGTRDYGIIFKLRSDGSDYTVLKRFGGNDGCNPNAPLLLLGDGLLYGTTGTGGAAGAGTIFRIATNGAGFTVLKHFDGQDGGSSPNGITLVGSALYGTCNGGGLEGNGTIFRINTDGTDFQTLRIFNPDVDGRLPSTRLAASGATLYGTANDALGYGEIFQIGTDGNGFQVLKSFTGRDGSGPSALLSEGTSLWGLTSAGGRFDAGVAFSFSTLPAPDPCIKDQPQSLAINSGDTAQLDVDADGTPALSYQWFKDGTPLADVAGISGSATSTLLLSAVVPADAGGYSVVITNQYGSVTSVVAVLTVRDPFLLEQPQNQTVYLGSTATFTAVAGGTPTLGYQWQKDGTNLNNGGDLSGANTPALSKARVSAADAGIYSLLVTNSVGIATSSPALLTVVAPPPRPGILGDTELVMDVSGPGDIDSVTFMFGAGKSDWLFDDIPLTTNDVGRLIPITQADDPDFSSLVAALQNGVPDLLTWYLWGGGAATEEANMFSLPTNGNHIDFQGFPIDNISLYIERLTITHGGEAGTAVSFRGRLYVNSESWPEPAVVTPPLTQTAEEGSSVQFTVQALSLPAPGYQWCWNGAALPAATSQLLALPAVNSSNAGAYSVVLTNPFGSVTSAPAILSIVPLVPRRPVPAIGITAETGSVVNVQFTDSLAPPQIWNPLATSSIAHSPQLYFDVATPLPARRFYRALDLSPGGSAPSAVPPRMVPALTLAGSIGSSVRIDTIYAIGPTDAWFTLDTIVLTNTTQLYFDVSAPGDAPRLYRLVPLP